LVNSRIGYKLKYFILKNVIILNGSFSGSSEIQKVQRFSTRWQYWLVDRFHMKPIKLPVNIATVLWFLYQTGFDV
jgi:hypothetical protein